MSRQRTCIIPGCNSLPAYKGKCTYHLGFVMDGDSTGRHKRMRKETPMPRQFQFFDAPPRRVVARKQLEGGLLEFAEALQANPGRWAQCPPDLIDDDFGKLSQEDKERAVARMARAISKGVAWRRDGGVFKVSKSGFQVWASWLPDGEVAGA